MNVGGANAVTMGHQVVIIIMALVITVTMAV